MVNILSVNNDVLSWDYFTVQVSRDPSYISAGFIVIYSKKQNRNNKNIP